MGFFLKNHMGDEMKSDEMKVVFIAMDMWNTNM
jgi:hypothetical protein